MGLLPLELPITHLLCSSFPPPDPRAVFLAFPSEPLPLILSEKERTTWQSHQSYRHLLGMKQVPKNSTTTSIFLLNIPSSSHLIAFLTFPLQDFKYIIMKNIPLKTKLFKEILIS